VSLRESSVGTSAWLKPGGELAGISLVPGQHTRKLNRSVYSGSIAAILREAVVDGKLTAGTPLIERDLAEQLSVSRGPIRSALQVLEGEGLVETKSNGRMAAVGFARHDLADLMSVRCELESTAIRWGMERSSDVGPVLNAFAAMEAEKAPSQRLVDLDIDFHRKLVEFSSSRFLRESWLAIAPVVHTVIVIGNRTLAGRDPVSNFARIIDSHRKIVDALLTDDPDLAVERLASQFRFTGSMFD